ncbi:hypothetical protein HY385_01645 [Candidatus Daviesbacteria bacterium]|nr:hypothetical protein [Candidatus Daviesbacteria bacterium]
MANLKQKIIIAVAILGAALILIFQRGLYDKPNTQSAPANPTQVKSVSTQTGDPQIVATNPTPLENSIIFPTQTVEITFNQPLENRGEFKNRLDPKADYEIKLSEDRKTAKIIPTTPFKLGTTFTLFILPDTKFDGHKLLNREIIIHFRTIEYKGV